MSDTAHIWVGSDVWQRNAGAERVLEYSIRKHASCPVQIHWMTANESEGFAISEHGEIEGSWKIGRPIGQAWPKRGWGTSFSAFRVAIPELSGYRGRHIYMDVDQLVLGDVAELLALPLRKPWCSINSLRTDVSVIDCSGFANKPWWPRLSWMRPSGTHLPVYRDILSKHDFFDESLPPSWNCCDDRIRPIEGQNLLHFTVVPTQPWRPYSTVNYQPHPNQPWVDLWNQYEQESLKVAFGYAKRPW